MTSPATKTRRAKARRHTLNTFGVGALTGAVLFAMISHPTQSQKIYEDSPAWDCRTMGNHLCGPGNSNNVTPGLYQDGELAITWETYQALTKH